MNVCEISIDQPLTIAMYSRELELVVGTVTKAFRQNPGSLIEKELVWSLYGYR